MRQSVAITCPLSKYLQILYIFAEIFKYFVVFCSLLTFFAHVLPAFWKITRMPLLSRISPVRSPILYWKSSQIERMILRVIPLSFEIFNLTIALCRRVLLSYTSKGLKFFVLVNLIKTDSDLDLSFQDLVFSVIEINMLQNFV